MSNTFKFCFHSSQRTSVLFLYCNTYVRFLQAFFEHPFSFLFSHCHGKDTGQTEQTAKKNTAAPKSPCLFDAAVSIPAIIYVVFLLVLLLPVQKRPCQMSIKKLNQRSHKKCCNDRSDSYYRYQARSFLS